MKKTITVEVEIKLKWNEENPYALSVEGPHAHYIPGEGGEIYFSESDGTSLVYVLEAIRSELPTGAKIKSNKRECWIEHWGDELMALNGRTFTVRFTSLIEVDEGELCWLEDRAELVK
jgi:hypothetical protein